MLGLPLAFAVPAVLAALALLPALWVLLRLTPPRPREVPFPPLRLILDLRPRVETPARTPWWLLLLRLLLAAAVIVAMAGPIWNPLPAGQGSGGPLLLVLDDGWPAAPTWEQRIAAAQARVAAAEHAGEAVALAFASDGGRDLAIMDGGRATDRVRAAKPKPFVPDRAALLPAVQRFLSGHKSGEIVWIADGLASGGARAFAEGLAAAANDAPVRVLTETRGPLALAGVENQPGGLEVNVVRADAHGAPAGRLRALDAKGLTLGETAFAFGNDTATRARFDLPIELRNEIARIDIAGEASAGAVSLLDNRFKRRRVGLVSGATVDVSQPLLAPNYYLRKALAPFADLREPRPSQSDPVTAMLDDRVDVMMLADVGMVTGSAREKLVRFVEEGGVLVRFAGTRLAGSSDDLVPVRLRRGGRVLGGSLSWDTPKRLAPFERESPFYGLAVPQEVTVNRQVLAEPEAGLPGKTWAALADGTPLVTAVRRGKGLMVLVHVTADTTWSNLPLSGLFVDMLRRMVALSGEPAGDAATQAGGAEVAKARAETLSPTRTLDGFGVLGDPPPTAKPIAADFEGPVGADHPPGFYGPLEQARALNALQPGERLAPADFAGVNVQLDALRPAAPVDLRPALVAFAFLLFLLDALATIWLSGGLRRGGRRTATAALGVLVAGGLIAGLGAVPPARAADGPPPPISKRDLDSALHTRLAYVVTGDARVDEASRSGLETLSRELARRTSLNPGDPVGVDPARDELVFYPLIYWPIAADRPQPAPRAVEKIATFMKEGGTVVFDTRDALTTRADGRPTPEAAWLRTLLAGVDVPELEPVPRDHVVTKTFYLLDNFVGRTSIGQTWIEALPPTDTSDPVARPARAGDDVSPIVITSNDLAAAWASDRNGNGLYPLVPGGARQRELSIRAGINLVMYTLTGNYKADQVHVRDLLERLAH